MNTQPSQVQLKISLSEQLNKLLALRAASLGIPVTQFVKHLILSEVESGAYPTFRASRWLEERTKKAMRERGEAVEVRDVQKFLKEL